MSGAGVGETPNAAFAALSARGSSLGIAGLPSGITELEHFLKTGDDKAFTEGQDRRCRALNGLGLSKADKVTLAAVPTHQTSPIVKLGDPEHLTNSHPYEAILGAIDASWGVLSRKNFRRWLKKLG